MLFNSWWTWPSSRTFHSKESMNGIASMYDNRKLYSHIWIIAVVARGYFLFHNPAPTGDFVVSNKRHAHALLEKKDKKILAPPGGLEPPTFRLTAERASRLRHGGIWRKDSNLTICNQAYYFIRCDKVESIFWKQVWEMKRGRGKENNFNFVDLTTLYISPLWSSG